MGTSLAQEQEEQRRWKLRPKWAHVDWFDRLVANEFLPFDEQRAWQQRALARVIRFAGAQVPYYRDLFAKLGLSAQDFRGPDELPKLPLLTKRDVHEHEAELLPKALPRGERMSGHTLSSGTTGRPTKVFQTLASTSMFALLKQREYRWFRFDPSATLAAIRVADELANFDTGGVGDDGATSRLPFWEYVGEFFETGPFIGYSLTNPIERQMAWLERHRPGYLLCLAGPLEHLAFAFQQRPRPEGLRGMLAISQQLTPAMRRRIEQTLGAPVHQNYGLNEIGIVAAKCEAGRYHVHTEHCLVEILDEDGQPCAPGETGRIVVTALRNLAMPLIRYDADDLAEAVEGPCPCGRTLPSFGEVVGRYRRCAFLPPGTIPYVIAIRDVLAKMPVELAANLRQYQLHQFRNRRFELRLLNAGPLPPEFSQRIREAWRAVAGSTPSPLEIVNVDHISCRRGGKFETFTSDFYPEEDHDASPNEAPTESQIGGR